MIWCSRRSLNRKYRESRAGCEKSVRFIFWFIFLPFLFKKKFYNHTGMVL